MYENRIIIFDVPADKDGALTILNQYYEKAKADVNNYYIFVLSTPKLEDTINIKVVNYEWVKKSWFHRLYFDKFIAKKIIVEYNPSEILSLQNTYIEGSDLKQTVYLHQSLPFVEKKFRITENFKFWVYQNIIGKIIFKSLIKSNYIIVQTQWMKNAILEKLPLEKDKIIIEPPNFNIDVTNYYEKQDQIIFFYPAQAYEYKNHLIIIEAMIKLKEENIDNYKVVFTLNGYEKGKFSKLKKLILQYELPVDFVGRLSKEEVYNYYTKSILLFPSYIETFGLPLLEAKMHKTPILASNCNFSREIMKNYRYSKLFNPFEVMDLYKLMKNHIAQ